MAGSWFLYCRLRCCRTGGKGGGGEGFILPSLYAEVVSDGGGGRWGDGFSLDLLPLRLCREGGGVGERALAGFIVG